jgi:glycine/D-amino acid oxidase-like deaminating enzyme
MVVYATHVDSRRFSAFVGDEIVPIRGQGMVTGPGVHTVRGAFATHWKLNVWRSDNEGRMILGGWRHDAWDRAYWKMNPEVDHHLQEDIQGWFEQAFPDLAPMDVHRRWSGIFGWTADYLPLVGPLPGRMGELVISGFSGGGLPFAFEAGRVIASIVSEGDPVPGGELLNPRRFV